MKDIQIIIVVETNVVTRSDDVYYSWLLKNYFTNYVSSKGYKGLRIRYKFVYMDGKTNYNSPDVQHDIMIFTKEFVLGASYVVYCFDVDTKAKKNQTFIKEVQNYCLTNNYFLSFAYPEIEIPLGVPASLGSKHDRAVHFSKNYPKKSSFPSSNFYVPVGVVPLTPGLTNFCAVIQEIINCCTC